MSESERPLIDELARIEHRQWWEWSNSVAQSESLSDERIDRWSEYWVPYDDLPADVKEQDREWVRKVLLVLHRRDVIDLGGFDSSLRADSEEVNTEP